MADYSGLSVKDFKRDGTIDTKKYNFDINKDTKAYDSYILAWCYYWNQEIEKERFGNNKIFLRPDVIKAMIEAEGGFGNDTKQNSTIDVMQCLVPGDYALWILSGYNPYDKRNLYDGRNRYHFGKNEYVLWIKKNGNWDQASMLHDKFNYYDGNIQNTEIAGFGEGLGFLKGKVIRFIEQEDSETLPWDPRTQREAIGEYLVDNDVETINMSIACGTAYLCYNISMYGSEEDAVRAYNGGGGESAAGIEDHYVKDINTKLTENMGTFKLQGK